MIDVTQWRPEFATKRSRRVIFVAHCLLNENTRYLGGARCGGAVREIVQPCLEHDIGVVQPPCPEQHAWGGVLKRRFLFFHGSEDKLRYRRSASAVSLAYAAYLSQTRTLDRRRDRGLPEGRFAVLGIIGVDASPTCSMTKSLAEEERL